jgi:hypothetical protein
MRTGRMSSRVEYLPTRPCDPAHIVSFSLLLSFFLLLPFLQQQDGVLQEEGREDKRTRQGDGALRTLVMAATSVMSSSTAVAAVFLSSRVTEELTRLQLPSRHHQVRSSMIVFGTIASASGAGSPPKTVCSTKRRKIVVALRCSDSGEGIWGEDLWVERRLWSFFRVNLPCNIHPSLWSLFFKVLSFINKEFFFPLLPKQAQNSCFFCSDFLTVGKRDDDAHDKSVTIAFSLCCSSSFLFCEGVSESGRRLQQQQQNMDLELKKHSRAQLNWINSSTLFETHNMKM